MPTESAKKRAAADARAGKAASTQAGEFVREEVDRIRQGEHGARSAKQAIAIGLSEARKAGVKIPPKPGSESSPRANKPARKKSSESTAQRSRASLAALRKEPTDSVSPQAMSRQAKQSAQGRSEASRKSAAAKAVKTKAAAGR